MKGLVIPLAMALAGAGIGGGAAFALKPSPAADGEADDHGEKAAKEHDAHGAEKGGEPDEAHGNDHGGKKDDGHGAEKDAGHDDGHGEGHGGAPKPQYHKIQSQFVVPVIEGGRTRQLVVMQLALDLERSAQEGVMAAEPRLRDALLRVLFDHANTGGFTGPFTDAERMETLRAALLERARGVVGSGVKDVLVLNVARQEI